MLKNKLFYSFLSSLLLKKILLIAIRIYYCVILCYLVYKHSCLLAYCSLIYIRIISKDKLLGFNSIKGNITQSSKVKYLLDYRMFNDSYNNSNSNSNIKI
ncbi:hypothetical protein HBH64_245790 [Parastagonospora nodorum]|nr:hypothetical protein HBH48_244210 [Parastagonospora nodorum]KAH4284634.1 hypothetical protein HBI02_245490 [Parastagonospora nodorum]KAH4285572.1 hypothetical protein HBI01_250480 [Parastagonospora nodorum]KAH4399952.1 hypothetical protein HBH92_242590 [Parastagonospora nodorum]KAH4489520.1 hypothetical protein HBH88_117490 [Parastagonospora nodorum]